MSARKKAAKKPTMREHAHAADEVLPDYEIVDPAHVRIHDIGPGDFEYMRNVIRIIRLCGKQVIVEETDNEPIITIYAGAPSP
jgi:hypothetical protein